MPKDKTKTYTADELKIEQSENFRRIYCNNVRLSYTPWDVNMACGALEERGMIERPVIKDEVAITMSPGHFKAFAIAVMTNLRSFEAQYGEIKMPPGVPTPEG